MAEQNPPEAPAGVDLERPNPGRIYDWLLGGKSNWAIDRVFGERLLEMWPQIAGVARQNRAFLDRVVVDALDAGIRQFLDLGSGIPTMGNVHEIVQRHTNNPARVVYVDCEPVAAAHTQITLEHQKATAWTGVIQADLRDWREILTHDTAQCLLNRTEPVCLLAVAVLQFVGPDSLIPEVLAQYGKNLAPGSRVAVSHFASDVPDPEARAAMERFRTECDVTPHPLWLRDRNTITRWLEGLGDEWTLLDPGVAHLPDWRPDQILNPKAKAEAEKMRPFAWCGVTEKQ